jgi:hypothetical protein
VLLHSLSVVNVQYGITAPQAGKLGSNADWLIGIFNWLNPSARAVALGSTRPLTEMSTRGISWGVKVASS